MLLCSKSAYMYICMCFSHAFYFLYRSDSKKKAQQSRSTKTQPHTQVNRTTPLSALGQTMISGDYQPFCDSPAKQLRYEQYLSGRRKFNGTLKLISSVSG